MKNDTATTAGATASGTTQAATQEKAAYDYMVLVNKTHKLPDDWESLNTVKEWPEDQLSASGHSIVKLSCVTLSRTASPISKG